MECWTILWDKMVQRVHRHFSNQLTPCWQRKWQGRCTVAHTWVLTHFKVLNELILKKPHAHVAPFCPDIRHSICTKYFWQIFQINMTIFSKTTYFNFSTFVKNGSFHCLFLDIQAHDWDIVGCWMFRCYKRLFHIWLSIWCLPEITVTKIMIQ